jgi:hypothetical protein
MPDLISTFPALPLTYECSVVWEARDPTSGDLVTGVTITNPVLYGLNLTPGVDTSVSATPATPLWVPVPTDVEGNVAEG